MRRNDYTVRDLRYGSRTYYNVPPDQEDLARKLHMIQDKEGKWFLPDFPNLSTDDTLQLLGTADSYFGRGEYFPAKRFMEPAWQTESKNTKARALAEWRKAERAKRMKEQTAGGITDTEIQQRIEPKNTNLPTDPAGMRAAGLVPSQDYDASIAAADAQNKALGSAQRSGFPTYQHQGKTYGVMNPQAGKGGTANAAQPLSQKQIQQTAGTNIVSGSGAPVTAGHKMLTPGQRMGGMNEMSKAGKKAKNNKYKEVTKESNVLLKLLGLGRKSKSLPKKEPNITFTPSANPDTAGTYSPALDDMAAQIIRSNRKQTIDRENLSPALDDMAAQILQNQPVVIKPTVRGPHIDRSDMNETSSGSVAGVVNPKSNKPKSQIGSLFGGTYKQKVKK
jgi:hypothetical protein